MWDQPVVPNRPPPGAPAGALLGVLTGLLLTSIWLYGAWDVALAVTAVFAGLIAVLFAGAPGWRAFGTGLLVAAALAGGALALVAS
ncbi:hypothetical protein GCM10023350_45680 [Nocardioides endophyticus]|uniref:DUF2537 domain-containing protein n=1 Tax=Nocardioides endophyticus TaxID=1353775 RepID=A0ABP8ZF09_9ACTN